MEAIHAILETDVEAIQKVKWKRMTEDDKSEIRSLVMYESQRLAEIEQEEALKAVQRPAQRRAYKLLRSLLTAAQNDQLTRCGYLHITGTMGGLYRLDPTHGKVYKCLSLGGRYHRVISFCFHDPNYVMPPADLTIGHMLWLLSDEGAFLAEANSTVWALSRWMRQRLGDNVEESRHYLTLAA